MEPTARAPRMTSPITARTAEGFLYAWNESSYSPLALPPQFFRFARFGAGGALLDPQGIQAFACKSSSGYPIVACNPGTDHCLMAGNCSDENWTPSTLMALIDASNGAIIQTMGVPASNPIFQSGPSSLTNIYPAGDDFLLLYGGPLLVRVNGTSGAQSYPTRLHPGLTNPYTVDLAYAEPETLVVESTYEGSCLVTFRDAKTFAIGGTAAFTQQEDCGFARVTRVGPNFVVAWHSNDGALVGKYATKFIRVRAADHAVLDSPPKELLEPSVLFDLTVDGDRALAVFDGVVARISMEDGSVSTSSEAWPPPPAATPTILQSQSTAALGCRDQSLCRVAVGEGERVRFFEVARGAPTKELPFPTGVTVQNQMFLDSGDTYAIGRTELGRQVVRITANGEVAASTPLVSAPGAYYGAAILGSIGNVLIVEDGYVIPPSKGGTPIDYDSLSLLRLPDLTPLAGTRDLTGSSSFGFARLADQGLIHWMTGAGALIGRRIAADGTMIDQVDRTLPVRLGDGSLVATTDGYVSFYVAADGTMGAQRLSKELEVLDPTGLRLGAPWGTDAGRPNFVSSGTVIIAFWWDSAKGYYVGTAFRASDLAKIYPTPHDIGGYSITPTSSRSFIVPSDLAWSTPPGELPTSRAAIAWLDISDAEMEMATLPAVDTLPPPPPATPPSPTTSAPGPEAANPVGSAPVGADAPPPANSPNRVDEAGGCQLGSGPRPNGFGLLAGLLMTLLGFVKRRTVSASFGSRMGR